jgi:hypothetical protein
MRMLSPRRIATFAWGLRGATRMAIREFIDEQGRTWRAWDIKPEEIHPVTKAEDYLADCYVTGWIVFERNHGEEKRRLCPWPKNWAHRTDDELRELLRRADVIPPYRVREDRVPRVQPRLSDISVDELEADPPDLSDLEVIRTFRYPGGRFWTVCVVQHPEDGGPPLLRFQSGVRFIDLRQWPRDWADQPDDELVWMLRRASARRSDPPPPGVVPRRWDEQQSAGA